MGSVLFCGFHQNFHVSGADHSDVGLPGDAPGPGQWVIFMPANAVVKDTIKDRDIAIDDQGYRYQLSMAEWAPLGYQLIGIRLEA